jgi:hypothetical protein
LRWYRILLTVHIFNFIHQKNRYHEHQNSNNWIPSLSLITAEIIQAKYFKILNPEMAMVSTMRSRFEFEVFTQYFC